MPFVEVIYETGRSGIANYENDAEAQSALAEHHRRAVSGEPGGPIGAPAERIKRALVYDKHPNEYNPENTLSSDVAEKEIASLIKANADENGVVDVSSLAVAVRGLSHPQVEGKENAFDSNFKMKEKRELALNFEGGAK